MNCGIVACRFVATASVVQGRSKVISDEFTVSRLIISTFLLLSVYKSIVVMSKTHTTTS